MTSHFALTRARQRFSLLFHWPHGAARIAIPMVAALVASEVFALPAVAESSDRPNILLILADDLGYGDLSSYGAKDLHTPHVDRLVDRGMRLDSFYANCPVCSPTRAALLSGRYQDMVGVPGVIRTHAENSWGYLTRDAVLLPKVLKQAGYRTAIVGKWHLGLEAPNTPNRRGFDFFHGWLGDMMDDYYTHRRHGINYMRHDEAEIDPKGHATELFTNWSIDYLKDHAENHRDQPFFLYLAYNAPHAPIQPPEDWLERVQRREPDISPTRAKLVALIEHMDDGVGRVTQALDKLGLAENTLVVFTSDNGGQLSAGANNGPLRDGKQSMYEGGIKVPAVAVWPGQIAAGGRSQRMALSMDLFPTLVEAASGASGKKIDTSALPLDGATILPTLLGKDQPELQRPVFFSRREGGERYGGKTIDAVRLGDWKLLQNSPWAPLELYNLRTDPREASDLSHREVKKFRELSALLRRQIQRYGSVPWQRAEDAAP